MPERALGCIQEGSELILFRILSQFGRSRFFLSRAYRMTVATRLIL